MQIEFKLLADQVFLSQDHGDMPSPEREEIFALALVEGLPHQLDAILLVLDEVVVELTRGSLAHFVLQKIGGLSVSVFVQIFKYGRIDVLLGSGEVV